MMRKTGDIVNRTDGASDEGVLELIHALTHQYRSLQFRSLRDGPHHVTHMDSKVLGHFGRHPGATQMDLAKHSGRDRAQIARLIKTLRERGLLTAQTDPVDRRHVRLFLTPEGDAVHHSLSQQAKRLSSKAVAGLTADERGILLDLLGRVKGNLDSQN